MYDAMLSGLDAKIIRVGNLTNRLSDFKFLPNYKENAYIKLKSEFQQLKNDLQTMKDKVHKIKLYQGNVILSGLNTIASCYTDTYNRNKNYAKKM